MSGKVGYQLVTKASVGIFGVLCFGVWAAKNIKGVIVEIQDTQPDEFVGLITLAVVTELPKLFAAFNAGAEEPLV